MASQEFKGRRALSAPAGPAANRERSAGSHYQVVLVLSAAA